MSQFNVVVLGAGGVGKSALTVRFVRGEFVENYDPTIEEMYRRSITVDGAHATLEVLDTAGAEQFMSLNEMYIQVCEDAGVGFILVFSLTQEASLREVDNLRKQIYRIKGGDDVPIVIVGTKLDLTNEREVQRAMINQLAQDWKHPFYETSAKRNWHITDVFEDLVRQMRKQFPNGVKAMSSLGTRRGKKKGCIVM